MRDRSERPYRMASAVGIVLAASTLLAAAADAAGAAERKPGSSAAPTVEAEAEEPMATAILDSQPLFRVRGISACPAAQWAQAISERIATIMADRLVVPDAQVVIDEGAQSRIVADDRLVDVFNEHGVQAMTPAYEGDPQQPKVVAKEQWFAAPAVWHGSEPDASA